MLANRILRIRTLRPFSPRYSSTQTYPHPQLRALPFKLSPADAIVHMGPHASFASMFKGFFRSLGARFLPNFSFQPLQPARIVPVYFPAWIIDAEVEAEIAYGGTQRKSVFEIYDTYLPGSDFNILSSLPLLSRPINIPEAVPFTDELRCQYDTEVSCLPYTISPFRVLDIARSMSPIDAKVDDALCFTPTSIRPNLFAAYPILVPLYLARYEFTLPGINVVRSFTMLIEAYTPSGRIRADYSFLAEELRRLTPKLPAVITEFARMLDGAPLVAVRGEDELFVQMTGHRTLDGNDFPSKVQLWLNDFLTSPDTAEHLASMKSVLASAEDPRVREYTGEERYANVSWIKMGEELAKFKAVAEIINISEPLISIGAGSQKVTEGPVNPLDPEIKDLGARRAASVPSWWKEWQEMSGDAR